MRRSRTALVILLVAGVGLLLAGWTFNEARLQRREIENELAAQAVVLARSLGPGLTAASNAAREIDEVVIWKLLDNGRLLAELLAAAGTADPALERRLSQLAETNGLDTVAFIDSAGHRGLVLGEDPSDRTLAEITDVVQGTSEELILDPIVEDGVEHLAVAVARRGGGAVLVQIHALEARAFAQRLGVENLLRRLAGRAGVLYLGYSEEPGGAAFEVSWDDGPLPAAATTGEPTRRVRGRPVFEVDVPLESPAGIRASLRVGLDGEPLRRAAAAATRRTLLVSTVLAALVLLGAAFALVSRLRGLERMAAARELAAAEAARRRNEHLAATGALTAGLAHEVRSPLNAIGLAAQRLERKLPPDDERRVIAHRIHGEVGRLEGVLREFLDFARPVSDERAEVDLGELCHQVARLLETEAEGAGVGLETSGRGVSAGVDGEAIRRALINLTRNAIQASPRGSVVTLTAIDRPKGALLTVRDHGPGIDPVVGERLFDPFVTGRASGTGLGLSLVRRVAQEHGGSVSLAEHPDGGTEARLELPTGEG